MNNGASASPAQDIGPVIDARLMPETIIALPDPTDTAGPATAPAPSWAEHARAQQVAA